MKYMLDTNIVIYFLKNQYSAIAEHMRQVPSKDIIIPSIVLAELEYGARNSSDYLRSIVPIKQFVQCFSVDDFDVDALEYYGTIRATLKKKGIIIGGNDLLIASMALAREAVLVTHNLDEFSRVEGLMIEDWIL